MIQLRSAALMAAFIVLPSASYAQNIDPDAAAQSGVHKEAGKDIDARIDADANVRAGGKTQAEIDAEADANAGAQVGDDKPQQQNQSQ